MSFFRKHLNMHGKIVGFIRDEYLEVPAEALREAILNALCHRQYEKYNLTIGIAIYDDRIEIANPGFLPPQITPENIKEEHDSYPYNPLIANVLYSTDYIENWGSGVRRIIEACQKRDVETPTWTVNGGFVVVTFKRPADEDFPKDGPKDFVKDFVKELSDRQRIILELLSSEPTLSAKAISEKISEKTSEKNSVTDRTVETDLAQLKKHGIISREGGRKNGYWRINIDKDDK